MDWSPAPTLWLLLTAGGALLLGLGLAWAVIATRRWGRSRLTQLTTEAATRRVYREEEAQRRREEHETVSAPPAPGSADGDGGWRG